jgi:alcohol dehydrogenase (cytochrome c)
MRTKKGTVQAAVPIFVLMFLPVVLAAQQWTYYGGDLASTRFSPLRQINNSNVSNLGVNWVFQAGVPGKYEATPLFEDGILYFTAPGGYAWALDARTGATLWQHTRAIPKQLGLCCGPVNRGFALSGNRLLLATIDAHLLALDKRTGQLLWDKTIADYTKGYSGTGAPQIIKDKVIVGAGGAEFANRGFIDAYSIATGERLWRTWTIAGAGERGSESWGDGSDSWKRGGGSTWVTGSYDPELNLLYWGTGNPAPDMNDSQRPGDNLYSNSMLALDPETGKMKWYFQFTPHDVHDWDGVNEPVLADVMVKGVKRKLLLQANRNGFLYALDRVTGKFVYGVPFVKQTWAKGLDANGRPILVPDMEPTKEGRPVCPGLGGGKNWNHMAFSPQTAMVYVPSKESCDLFFVEDIREPVPFNMWMAGTTESDPALPGSGALRAFDAATGKLVWEHKMLEPQSGSALTTGGDLVFLGDGFGYLIAFDARSGKVLWKFQTGAGARGRGGISAPAITYMVDGKQHVGVIAGTSFFSFKLPDGVK